MNILHQAIGGKSIPVTRVVAGAEVTELVLIKELSVKAMDVAIQIYGNDDAMVKLVTGQDEEWIYTLKAKSYAEILKACDEINADFFENCVQRADRRAKTQERIAPGTAGMIQATIKKMAEEKIRAEMEKLSLLKTSAPSAPESAP